MATTVDKDLNPVLERANNDDLSILVEYIKPKNSEALTYSKRYKTYYPDHSRYTDLIGKEIRSMGGDSAANFLRSLVDAEEISYYEVVCDVAYKTDTSYEESDYIENIENNILENILAKALDEMSDGQMEEFLEEMSHQGFTDRSDFTSKGLRSIFRKDGYEAYKLTEVIASIVAKAILKEVGQRIILPNILPSVALLLAGPIGMVLAGISGILTVTGTAYSVTIPSVIQIAMMRKKQQY